MPANVCPITAKQSNIYYFKNLSAEMWNRFFFLTVSFMNKVMFNYNLVRSNSFLLFLFWGEPSLWIFDAHTAGHDEKVQQKTDAMKRHTPCSIPV